MYVCMYVCVRMYMFVCICTDMYVCMYMYVHVCKYMYMHVYACICMYMYGYKYMYMPLIEASIFTMVDCLSTLSTSFVLAVFQLAFKPTADM